MELAVKSETKEANENELDNNRSRSSRVKLRDLVPVYIPTIEMGLLSQKHREKRFLDFLKADPSKDWFLKFRFVGRISSFSSRRQIESQSPSSDNPAPCDAPSITTHGGGRFRVPFVRKVNWGFLVKYCKNWIKHPMNMALLVWLFFVAGCLVVLFLFMTGLLNKAIPKRSVRDSWTEIVNQILNALFTIMCLYHHPRISHHFVILCRWRPKDMVELRGEYCKNGTAKPQERTHMMVVVILLHITALSQYGLCFLYWAYTSKTRPSWPEILFIVLGIVAPVLGSLYTMFSPLGWKTESRSDEESQQTVAIGDDTEENELKSCKKRVVVSFPEWVGGLFDLWDDLTVFFLSFFCTFCVFGWNMERLGFGNMYVHIITFILLCCAPVLVFSVTALNINDIVTMYVVEITGILLCLCGFLYGGFWRIQMRRRFKLPANTFCCGYSAFTDFMQWLFCWSCSLAQEVRTGNFYDIEDDSFHRKESEVELLEVLASLPQENGAEPVVVMSSLELATGTRSASEDHSDLENLKSRQGDIYEAERDDMTKPPPHPFIQREEK